MSALLTFQDLTGSDSQILRNIMSGSGLFAQEVERDLDGDWI